VNSRHGVGLPRDPRSLEGRAARLYLHLFETPSYLKELYERWLEWYDEYLKGNPEIP
jgi:hypothetical protein